uniref:Uncharacterized protein n=1 Tax=Timspurckia oligopyrenoides TaxID=708627 RepID=A0A7S0ZJI9_9RHOD|mmetsp:Transcript_7782/g.14135  ORF Transcript_7782/g.14135 Transcript_7782/m.14135 type:complete len:286 (+) Transcript_7782:50-907(+)
MISYSLRTCFAPALISGESCRWARTRARSSLSHYRLSQGSFSNINLSSQRCFPLAMSSSAESPSTDPVIKVKPTRPVDVIDEAQVRIHATGAEDRTPYGYTSWPLNEHGKPTLRVLLLGCGTLDAKLLEILHKDLGSLFCGIYCCAKPEENLVIHTNPELIATGGAVAVETAEDLFDFLDFFHIDAIFCGPSSSHMDFDGQVAENVGKRSLAYFTHEKSQRVLDGSRGIAKLLEERMRAVQKEVEKEIEQLKKDGMVVYIPSATVDDKTSNRNEETDQTNKTDSV